MPVYIACDKCQKRLKIPENVVGHSIKCPACNTVFKADPAKVLPAEQPVHTAALAEDDEVRPARKPAAPAEDEGRVQPKPHKKAAAADDAEAAAPAKRKAAAAEEDDEAPRRRRRARDYDEDEEEYDEEVEEGGRRTPWYVMLPLLLLSFCAVGLALLWPIGFSWLDMDRQLSSVSFDSKMWIGIVLAIVITLLCLIFTLIPARSWLRFLLVLLFLGLAYGGSFAAAHWWKDLPFGKEEKAPAAPHPMPGPGAPGG
jgi:hypothetical protein